MKKNVIPRNATKLEVTFNRDTSHFRTGSSVIVEKNEWNDWTGGGCLFLVGHLRNPDICSIKVLKVRENVDKNKVVSDREQGKSVDDIVSKAKQVADEVNQGVVGKDNVEIEKE